MPDQPEARILIIEDEKAMVAGLQFNLEARGYRVSAVSGPSRARGIRPRSVR